MERSNPYNPYLAGSLFNYANMQSRIITTKNKTMSTKTKKASSSSKEDMVNHPPHYKAGGIEVIDYLQAKLSEEEFSGYLKGNVMKYVSRAGKKGGDIFTHAEDLKKAQWYMNKLVETTNK